MLRPVHGSAALPPSVPGGGYLADDGAGNYTWIDPLLFVYQEGQAALSGISTVDPNTFVPASGTSDNVAIGPTGSIINMFDTAAGAVTFTGFSATNMGGKLIYVVNNGPNAILIKHQDAGSLEANRVIGPDGADLALPTGYGARLFYDIVAARWRVIG